MPSLRVNEVIAYSNKRLSKQDDGITHRMKDSLEMDALEGFLNVDLITFWFIYREKCTLAFH